MTSTTNGYAAIVVLADLRVRVYGPYPTEPAAQDLGTSIGFTDPHVLGAMPMPLTDPDHPITLSWAQDARDAPRDLLAVLTEDAEAGRPAVLLLADLDQDLLLAAGPFDTDHAARSWLDTTARPSTLQPRVVTLTTGPEPHPEHGSTPHVILILDDPDAATCYGPWPDGLHATAWVHSHLDLDQPGIRVVLIEVAVPFDLNNTAPPHTPPTAMPGRTVVRVWDADTNAAVGLFADQPDAQAWLDSQAPHLDANLATITVIDPRHYPAT